MCKQCEQMDHKGSLTSVEKWEAHWRTITARQPIKPIQHAPARPLTIEERRKLERTDPVYA